MLKLINKIMGNKTSSPKGWKRGCLCKDNTYSSECCKGELIEQGIGATISQSNCIVKDSAGNVISTRTN